MASNKSDVRRPLCCAADDDAFPLPDYLAPVADREQVVIKQFIETPMPSLPPIPPPPPPPKDKEELSQDVKPQISPRHVPRTAIVAALQVPPRVPPPNPVPPPTFSEILAMIPSEGSPTLQNNSTIISFAVYNSEAPTKSAELSLPATAPLMTVIDQIPCTARPHLISTPSPAILYIGNTLYERTLPQTTNYADPIHNFLHRNSSSKPPNTLAITATSPTLRDLTVTLGHPYPFLHHADCEHLIIFTDVFQSEQENPAPAINHRLPRLTPCDVCRRRAADRFTVGDPLADASPFHYCANCFRIAHYSQDHLVFNKSSDIRMYKQYSPI